MGDVKVNIKAIEFVQGQNELHCNVLFVYEGNSFRPAWKTRKFDSSIKMNNIPEVLTEPKYGFWEALLWEPGRFLATLQDKPTTPLEALKESPYILAVDVAKPGTNDLNTLSLILEDNGVMRVLLTKTRHPKEAMEFMNDIDTLERYFKAKVVKGDSDPDYKIKG